jgi:hypothetical protein
MPPKGPKRSNFIEFYKNRALERQAGPVYPFWQNPSPVWPQDSGHETPNRLFRLLEAQYRTCGVQKNDHTAKEAVTTSAALVQKGLPRKDVVIVR